MPNEEAARQLREVADLLARRQASPYRISAYRHAAQALESLEEPLELILERGASVPGLDPSLLEELASTGHLRLLDRLRGTPDPIVLFCGLPGVGPKLAHLLHSALEVHTLEELAAAADEGRLEAVPGIGPRRAQAIRLSLAELLQPRHHLSVRSAHS